MKYNKIQKRDMIWAEEVRKSNKKAFTELFETYYKPLCEYAYRYVHDEEVMEDIVQEVFIRIWVKRTEWKPTIAVRAYLYKSVYNEIINEYRKKHLNKAENVNLNNIVDKKNTPLEELYCKDIADFFQYTIALLPERRKEILELRLLHELSYKEIASVLGITVNTVDTQIRRALKLLRLSLNQFTQENIALDKQKQLITEKK